MSAGLAALALIGLFATDPVATAPAAPTTDPAIDLYTIGPGVEWVERFGHSAICVSHANPRRDRCYNYGTTHFSEPAKMVWDFLQGRSSFWVSTSRPDKMIDGYIETDRSVWVQRLPLTQAQASQLAAELARDALPANRYYLYHHYDDNCTTRLRDFIDRITDGALARGATGDYPSLRELSRAGWAELPALLYLGDVLIGRRVDRLPTPYQAMFLPLVLRDQVAAVLGAEPEVIYLREGEPIGVDPPGRWPFVVLLALVAAPLAAARVTGRFRRAALVWAVAPCVALSILVWGIVTISRMPELRWNEVALVFLPTDLLLLVGPRRWRRPYARARVIQLIAVSLLRAIGILRQPLWLFVLFPLSAALAVATERPAAPSPPASAPPAPPES